METVKNFRMYKSGKAWVNSSILVASVGLGVNIASNDAHADVVAAPTAAQNVKVKHIAWIVLL
ncbi:hypothetical protein D3P96_01340 [Weissella viridescens]|uniref:KxYKxGKxW signal peptide n=1 Tax=Weissella viridescens TaxID=1629 RepID=A0A3P2RMC7_WEIVI|nr:KxYKxGKxW signal peptide domain-containing protein [Weissella viridescens]RRG18658.1 hypothetical protein D3P96_01340 [Weissella viridescens]